MECLNNLKMSIKNVKLETTQQLSIKTENIPYDVALERLNRFSARFIENTMYEAIQRKNSTRNRDKISTVLEAGKTLSRLNSKILKNITNLQ